MANEQLQNYAKRQAELARTIHDTEGQVEILDVAHCVSRLRELREKTSSETFKIMVAGTFKTGKSTFINALLGEEVLPAFATPCTAIINEIKYGEKPRAVLHFLNPQPSVLYPGVPQRALDHIRAHEGGEIPPIELPVDEIEDYVVIPMGMKAEDASKQSPFARVELFWPLDILKNGVEIIDSPGLRENPIRTQVTMGYLSQADTVIFCVSALATGSDDELRFLRDTLPLYGITDQNLFCVVNRMNQVRNDRERGRVRTFIEKEFVGPYTSRIYYINALEGLEARLDGDAGRLNESQVPTVERALTDYLTSERGRVKLATPARECVRCIRRDVLEGVIPQRRRALAMDLDVLKRRYEEAKPQIAQLEQQRQLILAKTDALVNGMEPDIRRYAIAYFNDLPAQIRSWVEDYEPTTELGMLPSKAKAEELANELADFLTQKLDSETRSWMAGPFTKLVEDKAQQLKDQLEGRLEEFYVSLDQVKFGITGGTGDEGANAVPVWQRVVAGAAGLMFGLVDVAVIGASTGLNADFAKQLAVTIAGEIALILLGLFNPLTFIAILAANIFVAVGRSKNRMVESAKKSVADEFCRGISEKGEDLAHAAVEGALESLRSVKELVGESLTNELEEMRHQMDLIIHEMEQGEENVERQREQLASCEERLRATADELDTFIFELVKK